MSFVCEGHKKFRIHVGISGASFPPSFSQIFLHILQCMIECVSTGPAHKISLIPALLSFTSFKPSANGLNFYKFYELIV